VKFNISRINFFKLLKFGTVGGISVLIDFSLTWLLHNKLGINGLISSSLGFLFSSICNFLLNNYWTFGAINGEGTKRFIKFVCICAIGLLLNTATVYVLTHWGGLGLYISKLIAVVVVFNWSFLASSLFAFKPSDAIRS